MFKRKEKAQKAILIEKKMVQNKHEENEVRTLYKMSYGVYNTNDTPNKKTIDYYLIFMTKKGPKTFLVPVNIYYLIKIDSLVDLVSKGNELRSFTVIKKATKKDIAALGWK